MGIDVSEVDFQQEVIEKSKTTPVMVDFWAEWCGPCRQLGPVLEKVEKEQGSFILVKVNTDQNQQLALEYKVNGIPDVKLFSGGHIVGQFTGALPEPMVLKFLENHLPHPELAALIELSNSNPLEAADKASKLGLSSAGAAEIYWQATIEAAKSGKDRETMLSLLRLIPASGASHSEKGLALQQYLRDNDQVGHYLIALLSADDAGGQRTALEELLKKIEQSKGDERDVYKADILLAFQFLGPNHELSNEFRKKLSRILF